jgi:hypothetical protein
LAGKVCRSTFLHSFGDLAHLGSALAGSQNLLAKREGDRERAKGDCEDYVGDVEIGAGYFHG